MEDLFFGKKTCKHYIIKTYQNINKRTITQPCKYMEDLDMLNVNITRGLHFFFKFYIPDLYFISHTE